MNRNVCAIALMALVLRSAGAGAQTAPPGQYGDRQQGSFGDIEQGKFGDPSVGEFNAKNFPREQEGRVKSVTAVPLKRVPPAPYVVLPAPADAAPAPPKAKPQ